MWTLHVCEWGSRSGVRTQQAARSALNLESQTGVLSSQGQWRKSLINVDNFLHRYYFLTWKKHTVIVRPCCFATEWNGRRLGTVSVTVCPVKDDAAELWGKVRKAVLSMVGGWGGTIYSMIMIEEWGCGRRLTGLKMPGNFNEKQ